MKKIEFVGNYKQNWKKCQKTAKNDKKEIYQQKIEFPN